MGQQDVAAADLHDPADPTDPIDRVGRMREVRGTFVRVPGVRLLGRDTGSDYVDQRYAVVRPDGQTVTLTRLLYLVVEYADSRLDPATQAALVGREYGRLLPVEQLARLVHSRLAPAGLVTSTADPVPGRRARPLLSYALTRPLVPTEVVRAVAGRSAVLFHPVAVAVALVAFVVCDVLLLTGVWSARSTVSLTGVGDVFATLALLLVALVMHEFGHAAACHYGGCLPGAVGAGVRLGLPVLWTEVTNGYRLDRRGWVRTDLGGLHVTALFVVATTVLHGLTGWAPAAAAALTANLFILYQLLPLVRLDGHHLLGDLTGIPHLFGRIGPILRSVVPGTRPDPSVAGLRRGPRAVVAGWALGTTAAFAAALLLLVVATPELVRSGLRQVTTLWHTCTDPGDLPLLLLSWVTLLILLLLAWATLAPLLLPFVALAAVLRRVGRLTLARRHDGPGTFPPPDPPEATMVEPVTADTDPRPQGADHWLRSRLDPAAGDATAAAASADVGGSDGSVQPEPHSESQPEPPPLTAASFTEEAMLRTRRTPPGRGWRRAVFVATNGNVDPGPSPAERRQAALIERIRRPVTSCRRIVVLSRKGGAGKTTTTLMLGHVLASHRGDRVVALDANPDAGSLAYRVARENSSNITSLLADVDRLASYADVRAHTSQAPTRLEVIASDDDPRISQAMGQHDFKRAIEVLDRHFMLILLDTGTGILDDAIQGILTDADQLVVVMPPALDGARVAASTLDWLGEHGYARLVRGAVAVINGVQGRDGLVQLDRIERHFAERCSAVVRIPWDRSLEAGARTGLEDLHPRTLEAYLELAAAVAAGFPPPERRIP